MKRLTVMLFALFAGSLAAADNLEGSDRLLCSSGEILLCFAGGNCVTALPEDLDVPRFIVVDLKKKLLSTTRASMEQRSTAFTSLQRDGGRIFIQGIELGRAFSFLIDEQTGSLTAAVSRNGLTVSAFGACTDANT